jgi:accessory colonization factor AcfC
MKKRNSHIRFGAFIAFGLLWNSAQAGVLYDSSIKHQPKDNIVRLFGPGGPHTAYIKAADAFEKKTGNKVEVVYGPESKWSREAQKSADVIFGSSEQSMTAYLENYPFLDNDQVEPLYTRRAVIVVQKGNPKNIKGFQDLLEPGISVVVTEGKGVYNTSGTGVWEDVAGRLGSLDEVKRLRGNIIAFEKGSGASFRAFRDRHADAWITWVHWPLDHADVADYVELDQERRIYRVTNVAVSPDADKAAIAFVDFIKSAEGAALFASEGWGK